MLSILVICGVLFLYVVLWFIPYITTVNKIIVNGDEITRSAIRFSEYPSYVYETDSNVSSSVENSPIEIQNFINKRNVFLASYLSENKLQKIENSVDPENFLLDKNNLIQIIPMQYSSQDYFLLVFCNGYCTNYLVSNEIESANYFVFKKNVVKFLNVNNELPLFRQVTKCLLIFDYVTGTYSFITDPL